ncbi:MAG TPA: TIGR01777 family oxidoreductase [Planctomicrobium sp.]|nr:TIGR01777 family oxidoreductase [Planctomicrobium sp.]
MNVFITGSSGLVGSRLVPLLESAGHRVVRLVRHEVQNENERNWETNGRKLSQSVLQGCDALIHLAGESVAAWRWTIRKKDEIYESRVTTTTVLADAIARMPVPPQCFLVASAVGYYGHRRETVLTEKSPPGGGFLSDVCVDWEQAADPVRSMTRVVNIRTGMVLSPKGGALKSMLPAFRLGLGGRVGSGRQYWSWISLEDLASLYLFCLENNSISGPVNGVSPAPVTNREFTLELANAVGRWARLPLPRWLIRGVLGEMGRELLLSNAYVLPQQAEQHGFTFQHPSLAQFFATLKRPSK